MNKERHESIIISTDQKNAIALSFLLFILIVAFKFFVIGYFIGNYDKGRIK